MRPRWERQACQAEGLPELESGRASKRVGVVNDARTWEITARVTELEEERLKGGDGALLEGWVVDASVSCAGDCSEGDEVCCVGVEAGDVASPSPFFADGVLSKLLLALAGTAPGSSNQCGKPYFNAKAPGGSLPSTSPALTPAESHAPEKV